MVEGWLKDDGRMVVGMTVVLVLMMMVGTVVRMNMRVIVVNIVVSMVVWWND